MEQMFNNISKGLYPSKNRDYIKAYALQRRLKIRAYEKQQAELLGMEYIEKVARRPSSLRTHKNVVITTPLTEYQLRNIQVIETAKDCMTAPINIAVKVLQPIIPRVKEPIIPKPPKAKEYHNDADKKEKEYQAKYYLNRKLAKRIAEIDAMPPPPMPECPECPYVNVVSFCDGEYVML
jgi:hypothetical protein